MKNFFYSVFILFISLVISCNVPEPPSSKEDIYGVYKIKDDPEYWCMIYSLESDNWKTKSRTPIFEKKEFKDWKEKDWDGLIYLNKRGADGYGLWKIDEVGKLKDSYDKTREGVSAYIEWIPGMWGLTVYPDGIYYIVKKDKFSNEIQFFKNAKDPAVFVKKSN